MQSPRGLAGMFTSFFGSFRGAKLHPEGAPAIDGDPIDTLADPLNTDDSSSNLRTSRVPFATSTGASFFSQGEVEL